MPRSRSSSRSSSSSRSRSSSPPRLDPSTLSLLDSYLSEKAESERLFQEIAEGRAAASVAGLSLAEDNDEDEGEAEADNEIRKSEAKDEETNPKPKMRMISVSEFRRAFGEDWQLSQFWYDESFANKLASLLYTMCSEFTTFEPQSPSQKVQEKEREREPTIAFLCCPTAYVAFQSLYSESAFTSKPYYTNAKLLEYDRRFAVLSPSDGNEIESQFVPYDIDDPENVPESLKGRVDIAVVDPPFLNEVTNAKILRTLNLILRPSQTTLTTSTPTPARFILLTSPSIELSVLHQIYTTPPVGPLRRTALKVEHWNGRLANEFGCWANWEGAQMWGGGA